MHPVDLSHSCPYIPPNFSFLQSMSTIYLLSTHSSNPLEAPPSDPRNRAFVRKYQSAKAHPDIESDSSEDEKKRDDGGTVQAYRSHIAGLYPEMGGRFRVKGLDRKDKENERDILGLDAGASTSRIGVLKKIDAKGKGRALDEHDNSKTSRQPKFVDLDEDMSDEGVPGVGECRVLVDEDEDEDEQHALSQGPAGSGGGHGSDVDMPGDQDAGNEEDIDLDTQPVPDVDDAGASSSSSVHLPSSALALLVKPPDEQHDIQGEMADLEQAVPSLAENYRLVDRLGSGTFSSVYKALDLNYAKYDNSVWQFAPTTQPGTAPFYIESGGSGKVYIESEDSRRRSSGKVYVAVKRIYVTSGPERVRNELAIMEDCRGCRHTSQLITAFRHRDQVVAVMPYCRNDDFRVRMLSHYLAAYVHGEIH